MHGQLKMPIKRYDKILSGASYNCDMILIIKKSDKNKKMPCFGETILIFSNVFKVISVKRKWSVEDYS